MHIKVIWTLIIALTIHNLLILRIIVAIINDLWCCWFMDVIHKKRIAPPLKAPFKKNLLLLSPRQTGKSLYLKTLSSVDLYLNLQEADTFRKLSFQKNIIEKLLTPEMKTVALDNIHRLPLLLDQVEHLNKTQNVRFILSASQHMKPHWATLPENADTVSLLPFCFEEVQSQFNLEQILSYGALPSIYDFEHKDVRLNDYVGLLFQADLIQSGKIRKIENFSRFLNVAADYNGQYLHFEEIAKLCEAPARTVREYFELLKEMRLGYEISCTTSRKGAKRSKFYFFDVGVSNALRNDFNIEQDFEKSESALKHFILLELLAYKNYRKPDLKIEFWCDYQGNEIDFLINNEIAIEVRATKSVMAQHSRRLKKFTRKFSVKKSYLITRDPQSLNVETFLKDLWRDKVV